MICRLLRTVALSAALTACAPSYRVVAKRCPTTTLLLADFVAGTIALGASALAYNANNGVRTGIALGVASGLYLGAHYSERGCAVWR